MTLLAARALYFKRCVFSATMTVDAPHLKAIYLLNCVGKRLKGWKTIADINLSRDFSVTKASPMVETACFHGCNQELVNSIWSSKYGYPVTN